MVGSPYQRTEHLVKDIRFIQKLQPEMVGIGPFIPHHETVFAKCEPGTVRIPDKDPVNMKGKSTDLTPWPQEWHRFHRLKMLVRVQPVSFWVYYQFD